jgi:transglutaminase-like putative cysteine protease
MFRLGCALAVLLCASAFNAAAATATVAATAGDETPAWLTQAAAAVAPPYAKEVPGVVLHNEQQVSIGSDGKMITTTTYAVRILTREGRAYAVAAAPYETDTGRIREMKAWLINRHGQVKKYGKDETVDIATANDVYDETHVKLIFARDDADVGSVFGYQSVSEERSLFPQTDWSFQKKLPGVSAALPALLSRYTLTLAAGWSATSLTFNHPKVEPVVNGSTYTWELRNLPPIEPEIASPEVTSLAPRLAIGYASAGGSANNLMGARNFSNWREVSRWYSELSDPQSAPDDAIALKARELTATAKTELDKIRAIGRYVQDMQYISIQIGVGRYRPHSAAEIFAKRYGDCKDKANLMRAMLRSLKIEAYPVLIYSGDSTFVREEWASPSQFNHCIIAVRVGDETKAPTVIQHATLGRLLIFDATDENTPVGDLPDHEQNSYALIAAGTEGALVRMPSTPPEANQLEREAEINLAADGSITANIRERSVGQSAVGERRLFRGLARPEYARAVENWITRGATGAKIVKVEPADNHADGRFALDVDFTAANYGQLMQERLLVFKPAILSRRESVFLTNASRKHAVVLESEAYTESVNIKLPAGFDVDELPDPVKLDTAFGSYSTSYAVHDGQLRFKRAFTQRAATIPPADYAAVRGFFERIRAAEQSPVVLAKK